MIPMSNIFGCPFNPDLVRNKAVAYRAAANLGSNLTNYPHKLLTEEDLTAVVAFFQVVDPVVKLIAWVKLFVSRSITFQVHGVIGQALADCLTTPENKELLGEFIHSALSARLPGDPHEKWLRERGYID